MYNNKHSKHVWFKAISLILIQSFLFTNIGFAAENLITSVDNSYLAPTINIQNGAISSTFNNVLNDNDITNANNVSHIEPLKTGFETKNHYISELNRLKSKKYINKFTDAEREDLRIELTSERKAAYLAAIREVLKEKNVKVITPEILFEAAKRATKNDHSTVKARVNLQPGTMNPLHYGHLTASSAGIIGRVTTADKNKQVKVMTLLANGGTVPDKPFAAKAETRNEMARKAIENSDMHDWTEVTPIRGQAVDMFLSSRENLVLAGKNESSRRFNMDMASFIWLFVANPNVEWVYLVGSDKVAGYGKKNEKGLLVDTLSRPEAHASVVYFGRKGEEIDYENDIKKYDWLDKLWKAGFFKLSTVSSFADLSATKVRTALVNGDEQIDGISLSETMPTSVSEYIRDNRELMYLYPLEMQEKKANKLVSSNKLAEGLKEYAKTSQMVKDEIAKDAIDRAVDLGTLNTLYLMVLANEIRALASVGALKEISQIFLIYSAAPGTGKGELMDNTFEKGKGKFADIIGKIILYHTRNPRVKKGASEKDGLKYHFRTQAQLKDLEAKGKIVTALVNRQLQGLAIEDFVENGVMVQGVNNADLLQKDDIIKQIKSDNVGNIQQIIVERAGKTEKISGVSIALDSMYGLNEGDTVTDVKNNAVIVDRQVKGMSSVFAQGEPVVLEGGYGWFNALVNQNPEIVSMFIAPFADKDIQQREANTAWINQNFSKTSERLIAYQVIQTLIEKNLGEISLTLANDQSKQWQSVIKRAVEDQRIANFNAELLDSEAFVQDLNDLLKLFSKDPINKDQENLVRSLGYEVNRRIISREGQIRYSRGKRPAFAEGETDLQFDRYNRVLEGVVQILHRDDYQKNRQFGKKIINPWGYTEDSKKQIISTLTSDFTRFFFESILTGIRIQLATKGHQLNAPPADIDRKSIEAGEAEIDQILKYSDQDIKGLSIEELAAHVTALTNTGTLARVPDLSQIFLIYSAAPGTGKEELMNATFEKGKGKYADIIGKLILYHTRNSRVEKGAAEKDGIKYHFRTEKQLKDLAAQGKIVVAWVNRQLQGLAIDDFVETGVVIDNVEGTDMFRVGDKITEIGTVNNAGNTGLLRINVRRDWQIIDVRGVKIPTDVMSELIEGDLITAINPNSLVVSRQVKGLNSVFTEGKPVVLEGVYSLFNQLFNQNPNIVTIFLAPFSDNDIDVRERNTVWINANFNTSAERLKAYETVQVLIEKNKGEINLNQKGAQGQLWRDAIRKAVADEKISLANAELIESDSFINSLNELLEIFGTSQVTEDQYDLIRALAYEVTRRLVFREGELLFEKGQRPIYPVGETDPNHDRYNRVLEGVVQILKRDDYDTNRQNNQFGKIIDNPWGYTEESKKQIISDLTNGFTRFFFETIIAQVTEKLTSGPINRWVTQQLQTQVQAVGSAI
ncbi:MAG: hypothetical protein KKD05_08885 [Candidatus Omnitrophica bacterium]|nr:hypothetical protein [Candidatus Omnitrophota bacterium]